MKKETLFDISTILDVLISKQPVIRGEMSSEVWAFQKDTTKKLIELRDSVDCLFNEITWKEEELMNKREIALIGNIKGEMIEIPAELFYLTCLPFGWYLISIYEK